MTRRDFFLGNLQKRKEPNVTLSDPLSPWQPSADNPWDISAVNYIYHRLGFGATNAEILAALAEDPQKLIIDFLDNSLFSAAKMPLPPQDSDAWLKVPPYTGTDNNVFHTDYQLFLKA